jgi:hypothetical protein
MKRRKYESLWVGVIYFLILLGIALWVRDIPNQLDSFNITLQQLIKTSPWSDPKYFAMAAIDIAEHGWISSANDWIFNLWPPGFVFLEALIIKTLGPGAPVLLVLQILASVLFSVVLLLLYELLSTCVPSKLAFTLPLLIFTFPVSRVFLLQPIGVSLGESFAIGFFLVSVLLALRSVLRSQIRYAIYAGLCLALSAYFRSQFELILLALTGWGVLLVIAIQLTRLRKTIEPKFLKSSLKTIAVVLLIAHSATVPWRAYHWIYQGDPSWVQTSNLVYENSVKSVAQLPGSAGFMVAGGGNLVCKIDPAACGDIGNAKRLFFNTLIMHPIEWYSHKFDVIGKYWFSSVQNWTDASTYKATSVDVATNGIFLIALIALAAFLFTRKLRSYGSWILLVWFNAALFSAYLLIFSLVHFEVRYFYFPKIAGIFMALIVVCQYFRPAERIDTRNNGNAR